MAAGRPAYPYDPELADLICERIATTPYSLEDILDQIRVEKPQTPSLRVIYNWLRDHEEFQQNSARARELQGDYFVDLAVKESMNARVGQITTTKEWGEEVKVADNVERSKLIVQTLLRRAGQLAPKKYGEKLQHTGADGDGPVQFVVTRAGSKEK